MDFNFYLCDNKRKKKRWREKLKQKNIWPELEPESDSLYDFLCGRGCGFFYFNGDDFFKLNTNSFLAKGFYN